MREDALVITKILYSRGTSDSTAIHQAEKTMSTARAIQENQDRATLKLQDLNELSSVDRHLILSRNVNTWDQVHEMIDLTICVL